MHPEKTATGGDADAESDPGMLMGEISSWKEERESLRFLNPLTFAWSSVELERARTGAGAGREGGRQQKICAT